MWFEVILFTSTALIMGNIYTEGKYIKTILSGKKYFQMGSVAIAAILLYMLVKKNPLRAKEIVCASNEYIKYLPIDKTTSSMISPIVDFTTNQMKSTQEYPTISNSNIQNRRNEQMIMNSGKHATKRCVSETKKKYVAARQEWKCSACGKLLTATFEIDHIKRLEYGGDNHVDNLTAMCKSCHGDKTMMENL